MSFILDALQKIEQDKRRSGGSQIESIAVSRGRFGGRQHLLLMVAIAVGSALLTAAAVSFLNNRTQSADATAPVAPVEETAPPEGEAAPEVEAPPEVEPETPQPAAAPPVVTREASVRGREPEPARAPEQGTDPETEPDPELASIEEAPEDSTQAIRLVGRDRVLLDGLRIDAPAETTTTDAADSEPLPEDFPALVLQGTSVIGNDAVAVISDQRVFEGDRIEGALVIRIGEREVELELDGRRFTLRL